MDQLRTLSGARCLLALKCFASWPVFDVMQGHMDGTTSSSLFELKLGREKFGKEAHAYSVAWADHEVDEAIGYADKIIFNFYQSVGNISGVMIHYNCENDNFDKFSEQLVRIENEFGSFLHKLKLEKFGVQVYLEPGEAAITGTASLEVSVLDILENDKKLAIVDSSVEAHMLDLLIYRESGKMQTSGTHDYMICGKSCLAGDIFGEFSFPQPLKIGDRLSIADAAGYTLVKKNWFNGVKMPSIVVREMDGSLTVVRGVAQVVAHKCAQNNDVLGDLHIASRTKSKCDDIVASVHEKSAMKAEGRFVAHALDATDVAAVVEMIRKTAAQIVINVGSPFVNMSVLQACIETGAAYMDTAIHEEPDKICETPPWYANYEWKRRAACKDANVTAILGVGFDPGVVNAYARFAVDEYLDSVESIDIVDINAGSHGRWFSTNFDPEINFREFTGTVYSWQNGGLAIQQNV
ncbi:Carboxynorspermidine/carboxyspermidine decarboxylase [Nymphon striatum]|nr:Carboxynorspermidine/carboxyspermidine decarboxylase [Nymphon striatum]